VRHLPRVLHVGPRPFDPGPLGERYRALPALPPAAFERLVSACDAVVSFNASATSTLMALATHVPVILLENSSAGRSVEGVEAELGQRLTADTARWLVDVLPLHRFRVWPLGLFGLLEPVLRDNPFLAAVRSVEILDEEAFAVACGELISPGAARDEARSAEATYCERVRTLPTAAEVLEAQLSRKA
jgi:hypothetical protein